MHATAKDEQDCGNLITLNFALHDVDKCIRTYFQPIKFECTHFDINLPCLNDFFFQGEPPSFVLS